MNNLQIFSMGSIQLPVRLTDDGQVEFDVERAAIGLGICLVKNGVTYVRWERVRKYLNSPQVEKGDFITEPQFYKLSIKANNATAERFQNWVTNDVLPSIRKNGVYLTDQKAYDITHDKDALGKLLVQAGNQLMEKDLIIQEMRPKAEYTDHILANPGLETTSVIAKNYGYSPISFNRLLHELGIQYKQGKTWLLYAKYQDKGYTHVEPFDYINSKGLGMIRNTTKWTQKGQRFLYDFLKSKGIFPMIEKFTQEA